MHTPRLDTRNPDRSKNNTANQTIAEKLESKARKLKVFRYDPSRKRFSDMICKKTEDPFASSTTLENAFGCCKDQTKTSQALKVSMILPLNVHLR
jgi:hypothetical protein